MGPTRPMSLRQVNQRFFKSLGELEMKVPAQAKLGRSTL
jgi:hypothetical protein